VAADFRPWLGRGLVGHVQAMGEYTDRGILCMTSD
jgi:hypothetical protein